MEKFERCIFGQRFGVLFAWVFFNSFVPISTFLGKGSVAITSFVRFSSKLNAAEYQNIYIIF